MKKTIISLVLLLTLFLAACGSEATETPPEPTPLPPTEEPEVDEDQPTPETVNLVLGPLGGTTWAWFSLTGPEGQDGFVVDDPLKYTLFFQEDGSLGIRADCNNAFADFMIDGDSLAIEIGPMTRAQCPPGSRSNDYLSYLGSASNYYFENGNLFIELMADGGIMEFTPEESAVAIDDESTLDSALFANDWMWVEFTSPVEKVEIENPQVYHLTFQDDGLLEIVADCNNAHATYKADGSTLSIDVGPMTLALCPPESRSDDFINYLGFAAKYFFEGDDLFVDLMADGGTMKFSPFDDAEVESGYYEEPYYIVGKGDTLYAIGVRFGIPWQTIASVNGVQGTLIFVGQHLLIPDEDTVVVPAPEPGTAERVAFEPGSITATRRGIINQGVPKTYILRAQSGQRITISTESSGEPLVISVGNTNGDLLPLEGTNSQLQNAVAAVLPETGDFIVTIRPTVLPESPELGFTIQFTIQ
jgi:heat shock protein HslJ/LysM repeat protein